MPGFISGDELGSVKTVSFFLDENKEWKSSTNILREGSSKASAIQKLAFHPQAKGKGRFASAHADGSTCVVEFNDKWKPASGLDFKETRLKEGQKFVGLAFADRALYSCTSNGALRRTVIGEQREVSDTQLAALPMRLAEFRLAPDLKTFAYAGDEVELSMWDAERAFDAPDVSAGSTDAAAQARKRKRSEQLLPHEIWRAKNLPNDNLNLRQPVRNTALTYRHSSAQSTQQLFVGTQFGDVRRYDTRAARRPVSNWKGAGKIGAIRQIETGLQEHEVFLSDGGSNLFALDARNGRISYGYKGLSGAVTSIAVAPSFLASAAEDRFLRFHSTFPPPAKASAQQEEKGQVLEKVYMKVTPTAVVWDGQVEVPLKNAEEQGDEEDDTVWDEMQEAESDEEGLKKKKSKSK